MHLSSFETDGAPPRRFRFAETSDALPVAVERGRVAVDGCQITWSAWGERGAPAAVLVHGARAHLGWWLRVLTPSLRSGRRLLALDLSGHGESGHRDEYSPRLWAEEVIGVIEAGAGAPAAIVAHSMGGHVGIVAAARHPEAVARLVLVDTRVELPDPDHPGRPIGMAARPLRVYGSREEAVESFRLLPAQPLVDPGLVRAVAAESVAPAGEGWSWKFDPWIAQRFDDETICSHLEAVRCPLRIVYGAESDLVSAATVERVSALSGQAVAATAIPGAHHHVILDRPVAVAAAASAALGPEG